MTGRPRTVSIRQATTDDVEAIATMTGEAMADYAWTRWTVPGSRYSERLVALQRLYLTHLALPHGLVVTTDDRQAVAAFVPAAVPDLPHEVRQRVAELHGHRLERVLHAEEALAPRRPRHDWVLACAAVAPGAQGTGLGTAVVTAGLDRLDADRATLLVETATSANVRFYERLGWSQAGSVTTGGPTVHVLIRTTNPGRTTAR
ncbi:GNAT family N-acetyltransferase [Naasia sp. SYSU D00948]|uniref:GNAT family N-acetyltransferase n=1 Tax=Naasia sp. SYSU D00948 TaxID=2817379 RepID=UPI001B307074|nr:GNAT family N-acetyltransferase [Naasia sp. SYSU D00948]